MRRLLPHLLAAAALVLVWWLLGPTLELRGLAGAFAAAVACTGLGAALLGRCGLDEALLGGIGALGLILMPLSLGNASPVLLGGGLILAAAGWLRRPGVELPDTPWPLLLLVLLPLLAVAGFVALSPPVDTDEVYQHLALPRQLLAEGSLPTGELRPNAARPLPLHLVYASAMALGGATSAKLLHLLLGGLLLLRAEGMARRLAGPVAGVVALAALAGSYTVVRELGLAYNNLPTALACLLCLEACLAGKPWRMALFGAVAISFKYTAAPVLVGIWTVWLVQSRDPRTTLATGLGALAALVPWWLRNLLSDLHPLFPFAGWSSDRFEFVFLERYGMGREPLDLLLLPWNATVHAETTNYVFLGRISPLFLLGAVLAIAPLVRKRGPLLGLAAVAMVGCAGWAAGPHWLRYLLPTLPLLAVLAGVGAAALPRWGLVPVAAVWAWGLPSNLGPWLDQVPREAVDVDARVPGHDAAVYASRYLPEDAVVAVLFAWPAYYVERPYVLSSVEDHVPTRHLLYTKGDDTLKWLRQQGVTHVLTGRVNFIHKSYPFLDEATFREQFEAPEAQLEELLLAEGVLLYESSRYSVWRLR